MKHYTVSRAVLKASQQRGERLADAATRAIRSGVLRACQESESVRDSQYRVTVQHLKMTDADAGEYNGYRVRVYAGPGKTPKLVSRGGWYED